jgi:hypothetical protein
MCHCDFANNVAEDTQMNDTEDETDSRLVLRGGVAECYNSYFRYIVVEGEKFYPYEDLVLKFGKIAMTHALQSRHFLLNNIFVFI